MIIKKGDTLRDKTVIESACGAVKYVEVVWISKIVFAFGGKWGGVCDLGLRDVLKRRWHRLLSLCASVGSWVSSKAWL